MGDFEDEEDTLGRDDEGADGGGKNGLLVTLLGSLFSIFRIKGAEENQR